MITVYDQKMHMVRNITLLVLLAVSNVPLIHGESPFVPEAEFIIRSGMAEFESVESLLEKPSKLQLDIQSWRGDGKRAIRTETDYHAIYPVPVDYFLYELTNYENTKNNYPRVVESKLEYASEDRFAKHSLWVHVRVKVLNFGAEYVYVTDNWMEKAGDGYIQKYNLNRSPDGTLYQMLGNYYVEEIIYEGKPHTYIRQYAILGIKKGSRAMEIAMKAFGGWQLRQVFKNIYRAIEKRAELVHM